MPFAWVFRFLVLCLFAHSAPWIPCTIFELSDSWSENMHACVLNHFSRVRVFVTQWTVAHQAPLSMGLSRLTSSIKKIIFLSLLFMFMLFSKSISIFTLATLGILFIDCHSVWFCGCGLQMGFEIRMVMLSYWRWGWGASQCQASLICSEGVIDVALHH